MSARRPTALLLAALAAALVAAGCGGEEGPQIPRSDARELINLLQEADRRMSQARPVCGDVQDDFPKLEQAAEGLPEETDEDVRETVQDGVDHLRSLIEAECAAREETPEDTTDTTEEEPDTQPPEEEPQDPEPDTDPPDTTPDPPTTPTTPPGPAPDPDPDPDPGGGGAPVPEGSVTPGGKKPKKGDG